MVSVQKKEANLRHYCSHYHCSKASSCPTLQIPRDLLAREEKKKEEGNRKECIFVKTVELLIYSTFRFKTINYY